MDILALIVATIAVAIGIASFFRKEEKVDLTSIYNSIDSLQKGVIRVDKDLKFHKSQGDHVKINGTRGILVTEDGKVSAVGLGEAQKVGSNKPKKK